jgi:hypothetical protein
VEVAEEHFRRISYHKTSVADIASELGMIVAAMQENRAIIKAHIERMATMFEAIIREGIEAGQFTCNVVVDAALRGDRSASCACRAITSNHTFAKAG